MDECMARIEALESKQDFFKRIEDQDRKIEDLRRKISREEMVNASCIIVLHGLPLPKRLADMNISDRDDINSITKSISDGLGKEVAEFIFELPTWRPGADSTMTTSSTLRKHPKKQKIQLGSSSETGSKLFTVRPR